MKYIEGIENVYNVIICLQHNYLLRLRVVKYNHGC